MTVTANRFKGLELLKRKPKMALNVKTNLGYLKIKKIIFYYLVPQSMKSQDLKFPFQRSSQLPALK